jgi:PAS domain S-box-containing protein
MQQCLNSFPIEKILMVDNGASPFLQVSQVLMQRGCSVRRLTRREEALLAAQGERPHLILLAHQLLDGTGYEVCEQLKSNALTDEIPVIFLSTADETVEPETVFTIGGADYIKLPTHPLELETRLQQQEKIRQLQQQLAERTAQLHAEMEQRQQLEAALPEQDTTEARRAAQGRSRLLVQEKETLLALALKAAKAGVWHWDEASHQALWSAETCQLLGYDPQTCQPSYENWLQAIHSEDRQAAAQHLAQVLQENRSLHLEYRVRLPDGTVRWLANIGEITYDEGGNRTGMIGIEIDITDLKQSEDALCQERNLLSRMMETSPAGIVVLNRAGEIAFVNVRAEQILGLTKDEVSGRTYNDPDWQIQTLEGSPFAEADLPFVQVMRTQQPVFNVQHAIQDPDGKRVILSINAAPSFDPAGEIDSVIVTVEDITERKRAEVAWRESEARWQFALEGAGDGVWDWNTQTNEVFFSRQWKAMLGYEDDEVGTSLDEWDKRVHPEDKPQCYADLQRHFRGETSVYQNEHRVRCKDGSYKWILDRGKVIEWTADGQPRRVIGTHTDISDRKLTEQQLRLSLKALASHFDTSLLAIIEWDKDRQIKRWSKEAERIFGWSEAEMQKMDITRWQFVYEEDFDWVASQMAALRNGSMNRCRFENRNYRKDGTVISCEWHSSVIFDDAGNLQSVLSFAQDITERQRTETELRQQKEILQTIFDHLPVMVGLYSEQGDVLVINRELERVIGWGKEDYPRVDVLRQCYPNPADYEQVLTHILTADSTWKDFKTQVRDGRILDTSWAQIRLSDGRSIGIGQDISDRKAAELALQQLNDELELRIEQRTAALQASEARFRGFFDFAPLGIAVAEAQTYRFTAVNQAFCQLLGYSEAELLTLDSCASLSVAEDWALERPHAEALLSGAVKSYQIEKRYIKKNGEILLASLTVTAVRDEAGQITHLIGMVQDIRDRKRTEQKIQQTLAQLAATNQELESFSYSVSHDLRAPLRHINGFVNALRQKLESHQALSDPKVTHYLQVIETSSQKMALLIDGLLALSRIGRKPMGSKTIALRVLVDEAITLAQSNAQRPAAVEFVIGELPIVRGDPTLLQQVFANLIGNAVKFSRHQSAPRIEIGSLSEGTIFVRDNGVGFQMDYADKLFGAFQRLHAQTEFEGTGIGLAIVQRIIHRHGGTIWAESQLNQGATFYFKVGDFSC